jgi:flagellar M-ring protein FliF
MEAMKRIIEHLWSTVGRMAPSQIVLAVFVVVGVIGGTVLILTWAKAQYYVPLYSNLSAEEAGEVVNQLEVMGVGYEISDGGSSISVPSDVVDKTRMKLAAEGLPNPQNIGYALFDKSSIGMTDFLQKVNFRRALEGELARTIAGLEEVDGARVHLVIPEERLFEEDENPPSASVVLKLRGSSSLRKSQLRGISYLVASAVEGMAPENVTLIDYNGNLLSSERAGDETAMLSSTQFELRKNVEKYLEHKAETMLAGVIGPGRAIVRVTAELDFEQTSTVIESYDPDAIAIRSEQRTSQKATESSNQPTNGSQAQTSKVDDNVEDIITNYEVPKTVSNVIGEVGTIKRLSIAVLVDGTYEETISPEGVEELEYISRTPEELNRFAAITKNAVGYSDTRQDQFEIVNVPFDNAMLETAREELDGSGNWSTYFKYGRQIGLILLLVVAFFYLKKRVKRVLSAIAKYVPPPPPPPRAQTAEEQEIEQKPQKPKLIDTMKAQAQGKNEEIAKVIKTMMSE